MAKAPKKPAVKKLSDAEETLGVALHRFDPDEDFSDVDGDPRGQFAIMNEQSDRHYHWAHNSRDDIGQYTGGPLRYRVEYVTSDGVGAMMSSGQTEGEPVTMRDHVLVSCDKALWQKKNRSERAQTFRTNHAMFKGRQRDMYMDPENPGAVSDQINDPYVRPSTRGGAQKGLE